MNRGMTLEEAIEILEEIKELDDTLYAYSVTYMEALEVALSVLKEIQNYRKLGTLEELARTKKYIDLSKRHGTIGEMIDECAEYEQIGTVEDFRETVDKQKPKPCEFYEDKEDGKLLCPNCGEDLWDLKECGFNNCPYCGQAIYENLEGMEDE